MLRSRLHRNSTPPRTAPPRPSRRAPGPAAAVACRSGGEWSTAATRAGHQLDPGPVSNGPARLFGAAQLVRVQLLERAGAAMVGRRAARPLVRAVVKKSAPSARCRSPSGSRASHRRASARRPGGRSAIGGRPAGCRPRCCPVHATAGSARDQALRTATRAARRSRCRPRPRHDRAGRLGRGSTAARSRLVQPAHTTSSPTSSLRERPGQPVVIVVMFGPRITGRSPPTRSANARRRRRPAVRRGRRWNGPCRFRQPERATQR